MNGERRDLEASPHRCKSGCGQPTPWAEMRCEACTLRTQCARRQARSVAKTSRALPARYREMRLDGPELARRVMDPEAIALVRRACTSDTDRVVLVGPSGVGKTSLAAAAAIELSYQRSHVGAYVRAGSLALARAHSALGAEALLVQQVLAADLLVVDDLGLDPQGHHSAVADVLYQRYDECKTTIVTTSLTDAETSGRYGTGVARRLFEAVDSALVLQLKPQTTRPRVFGAP